MKVVCQRRKRSDVDITDCQKYAPETAYELSIGKTYTVYGQCLVEACLLYLIDVQDRQGLSHPSWYPASLFEVIDSSIPRAWEFRYRNQKEAARFKAAAIWGYPELAISDDHYVGLIERESEAMRIFLRRKAEIDMEDRGADQNMA